MKKLVVFVLFFPAVIKVQAQRVSFATDFSSMYNFSPHQQFFAFGQTLQFNFHLAPKESIYTWFVYHSPGRFKNNFTAVAKSPSTTPPEFEYTVKGKWNMKEFSIGWKHFFKGSYNAEYDWSLYGIAGLGIMFTKAENTFSQEIDTSLYTIPATPVSGTGIINRLTVDLGLGAEIPLGGNFFVYGDVRTYLPASSYPSPYLHSTKNVPLPVMANVGLRILFDWTY